MAKESFLTIFLTIIGSTIVLIFPGPISDEHRLITISIIFLVITTIALLISNTKVEQTQAEQQKLNERLKIHEHLIEMKAEIKQIQKEVFK